MRLPAIEGVPCSTTTPTAPLTSGARTMFDIDVAANELVAEDDGTVVEILKSTDEPALDADGNPVTITVAGMNSQRCRKADIWQRKALRASGSRVASGEEQMLMQSEYIARCVIGWSGFTSNGQPLPFSTENATKVFTRLPYIQRQVQAAMGDASRFTTKPAST